MKYMLMIVDDEKAAAALPPGELENIIAKHLAKHTEFGRQLRAAGKYVDSR